MLLATGLYLVGLLLITLFTDVIFGINAQSLAYVPLSLALVALVTWAMLGARPGFLRRWYTTSPTIVPGLLFLAGLAAALPHAHDLSLAGRDFLRWTFVWLVFAPVTRAVCSTRERARLCSRALAALIAGFAALSAADLLVGGGLVRALLGVAGVTSEGRYQSIYQNAGIFAGMLIVGLPLAVVPALTGRAWWSRLGWTTAAVVMGAGVLLSGSRAAVVASLLAIGVIGVLLRRRRLTWAVGGVVVLGALLATTGDLGGPPAVERFQHILTERGSGHHSLARRMQIWSVAGELIERRPVIGWGGSQLRYHQHLGFNRAHNAWLDAWLDGGLPAMLAMLLVAAVVIRRAWRTAGRGPDQWLQPTHVALVAASLAVLAGWLVRAGIGGRIDWVPIFMLCSIAWDPRVEDAIERNPPAGDQAGSRAVV